MSTNALVFLKEMIRDPSRTGAIAPSSRFLARKMAQGLDENSGHVVELGPGTGSVTKAILEAGVAPKDLTLMELNPDFCPMLRKNFQGVNVEQRLAQDLPELGLTNVNTIISSLPLLNMPISVQREILTAVFQTLSKDGVLVQFTYGPKPPIDQPLIDDLGLRVVKRGKTWLNIPPATVYEFTTSLTL